jgi:glycine oxidase
MSARDVIVVGGGAIGLAAAWRASQRGLRVTVVSCARRPGASRVAAGMLAPVSEAEPGTPARRLLELSLESARLWPAFARELAGASGLPSALRADGTLHVARDEDEAAVLERELEFRGELGLADGVARLRPSAARALEPGLAPSLRAALHVPGEQSVDPRWLLDALGAVAGDVVEGRVEELLAHGVLLAGGEVLEAEHVVLAAGAWSGSLGELPVRPLKGQILRLRGEPGLVERMIRFEGGYIVPRGDGRYVVGATVEERGFDASVTAGAAYELLRDASELVPDVLELEIEEHCVGFRPATPDNIPAIGPGPLPGLVLACGHHRNGILLAPLTAELVIASLLGETPSLEVCNPGRFSGAAAA